MLGSKKERIPMKKANGNHCRGEGEADLSQQKRKKGERAAENSNRPKRNGAGVAIIT